MRLFHSGVSCGAGEGRGGYGVRAIPSNVWNVVDITYISTRQRAVRLTAISNQAFDKLTDNNKLHSYRIEIDSFIIQSEFSIDHHFEKGIPPSSTRTNHNEKVN